jgi:hypothetical protein
MFFVLSQGQIMNKIGAKLKAVILWVYNHAGDARSKNCMIVALLGMTGFGIVAPQQATMLRDIVLSMPV